MAVYSVTRKDEALVAATAETLIQVLAPSSNRLKIREWSVSFDGVTSSAVPVDVDLLRQTTAGTASASTPVKYDPDSPAAAATASVGFTAEPTAGDVLGSWQITPNGGLLVMQYPEGAEPIVEKSGRIAIRALAGAAVNVTAAIAWSE